VREYCSNNDESQLIAALELGKMLLAEGCSLLALLSLHYASIVSLFGDSSRQIDIAARLAGANEFLTQVAVPFEMALRPIAHFRP
jgi:hypothetical protein